MAASVIVDAGFLVALLSSRDVNHGWAAAQAARLPPPWITCEVSVAEAFRLLGPAGGRGVGGRAGRAHGAVGHCWGAAPPLAHFRPARKSHRCSRCWRSTKP